MSIKINDLTLADEITENMQLETDIGGTSSNKITVQQLKAFVESGQVTNLEGLGDIELADLSDEQILVYNASEEKWQNQTNVINANDVTVDFTPQNYSPSDNTIKAHLEAIDQILGTLL